MDKLVIGVGTGRCGTKSLTRLLSAQPSTAASHERYGPKVRWGGPPHLWPLRLWKDAGRQDYSVVCEVAFYWTPSIETFLEWANQSEKEVRVVGLKRDRQETIESYCRWRENCDHWRYHGGRDLNPDEWDKCYPAYESLGSKAEGIGAFWDEVYSHLESITDSRVAVFWTEDLNTESGVASILDHCGIEDPNLEVGHRIKSSPSEDARNTTQW